MIWRVPRQLPETILLGAVIFGSAAFGAVEPWALGILSIAICVAVVLVAARGSAAYLPQSIGMLLLGVFVVIAIGMIQRLNPQSILEPFSWMPGTFNADATTRALVLWTTIAAALWCVPRVFTGIDAIRRVLMTLFLLGCALAVIGIIQESQYHDQNPQWIYGLRAAAYPLRPFGPYYNRDHAASMLVMAFFCGVGLMFDKTLDFRNRSQRSDTVSFAAVQIMILFGAGIIIGGLLVTRSRGAVSALLATSLALGLVVSWSDSRRLFPLIVGGILSLLVISKSPLASKISVALIHEAASERLLFYRGGVEALRDFPWLGAGLGAFQQAYYPYQSSAVSGVLEHVHCDWLELAIQIGVVGLTIFSVFLSLFLISCIKSLVVAAKRPTWGMACGLLSAVASFVLHGLIDFSFQTPANALILFILLGSVGVLAGPEINSRLTVGDKPLRQANWGIAVGAIMLAVSAGYPAIGSWRAVWGGGDSLATREMRLRSGLERESSPRNHYELARYLSDSSRQPDREVLREALAHSRAALAVDEASPRYRALQGSILWKLGRYADGKSFLDGK